MKQSDTKPKFQFSMKTLLVATTPAAVLSAIAGWLGPFRSIVVILTSCQFSICGGIPTWITLAILRRNKPGRIWLRVTLSVLVSAILFVQTTIFCLLNYYGVFAEFLMERNMPTMPDRFFRDCFFIVMGNCILSTLTVVILFVPVLIIGAICQAVANPSTRSNPATSRRMVIVAGTLVGSFTLPLFSIATSGNPNENWQVFVFSLISGAFGMVVPTCVLAWADRLGPKEPKSYTLPHLKEQEESTVRISERDLQNPIP